MSRILNCFTRGFRARPPASPQTTSPVNDDNDHCTSHSENEVRKILEKRYCDLALKKRLCVLPRGDQLFTLWALAEKHRRRTFDDGTEICYRFWDNFAIGAAVMLLAGQCGRVITKLFDAKVRKQPNNITVTLKSSNVPAIALPCFTVHAAKDNKEEENSQPFSIIKTCGRVDQSIDFASAQTSSHKGSDKGKDAVEFSCGRDDENPKQKFDNNLLEGDRVLLSIEECNNTTYNVQGHKCYKQGKYHDAFRLFELGSQGGSRYAQFNLGVCYQLGKGTTKDLSKAKKYYSRAARQGYRFAQYNFALLLLDTNDVINVTLALDYLEKAAMQGLKEAQCLMGCHLEQKGSFHNMKKAVKMFQLAANQEDPLATYKLAQCYEHGKGELKVDNSKAFNLYASAASMGYLKAHYKMAMILYNGCPEIEKNEELAMKILEKAEGLGHEESSSKLASLREVAQSKNVKKESKNVVFDIGHLIYTGSILPKPPFEVSQFILPDLIKELSPLVLPVCPPLPTLKTCPSVDRPSTN